MKNAIKQLALVDPELADNVLARLEGKEKPVSSDSAGMLVDETLWGLSLEICFGYAVAEGYLKLIGEVDSGDIYLYRGMVRDAGLRGPTFGKIMATYLAQVLLRGNRVILEKFLCAVKVMRKKGEYILNSPLESLSDLLECRDLESASVYSDLLCDLFAQDLSYNKCRYFSDIIPKAVLSFSAPKRHWQIKELRRVVRQNPDLVDNFLEGMERGLYLLSQEALNSFVSIGLKKIKNNGRLGEKFLSLESRAGIDACVELQVTVSLETIRHKLNRYLKARTGLSISVHPISGLPGPLVKASKKEIMVCSDGSLIYLPDEIDFFPSRDENLNLYKTLTKLEAGYYEFGTFDFDPDRLKDLYGIYVSASKDGQEDISELELFFSSFPVKDLAADLFTIMEHGRLRALLKHRYPGLIKRTMSLIQAEATRIFSKDDPFAPVFLLYALIALGMPCERFISSKTVSTGFVMRIARCWEEEFNETDGVEKSAEFAVKIYDEMENFLKTGLLSGRLEDFYKPIKIPFGRNIRPDLFFSKHLDFEKTAAKIKLLLKENGFNVYKSEVRKRLVNNNGALSPDDMEAIIISSGPDITCNRDSIDLSGIDIEKLLGKPAINHVDAYGSTCQVSRYAEWDYSLGDYLKDHVMVRHKTVPCKESTFYDDILKQHKGLVRMIRYSFELLKPESLKILRQWIEGDEFDYRALLDFAIDKKAGLTPEDRLYIKRMKQDRDVAVLLLVDLSRSTANRVAGSKKRVLDVEKEAIVLFCEALDVVGDSFAIAGFSGTGRFGVDYFNVKGFDECMEPAIKNRINAMAPQRSTRMGAAIRHAVSRLEQISSRIRLLLIIGDGFPNDVDYKQKYAIEDTRKAMQEARSKNIYAKAITVNIPGDPMLDDLYGDTHHNVISDVNELPDKLLRIYSSLTI
jgi:hypothetical protein